MDDFQTKSFSRAWTAFCGRPAQQKSSDRFLHRAFDFGTVTHSRCMFVCLLCSLRQCRLHCYCLLDWNAHAHQHIMRKGGRAIWTFGSITDCTVIFFLPFVAPFLSVPHTTPLPFSFPALYQLLTEAFRTFLFGGCNTLFSLSLVVAGSTWQQKCVGFLFFACRKK